MSNDINMYSCAKKAVQKYYQNKQISTLADYFGIELQIKANYAVRYFETMMQEAGIAAWILNISDSFFELEIDLYEREIELIVAQVAEDMLSRQTLCPQTLMQEACAAVQIAYNSRDYMSELNAVHHQEYILAAFLTRFYETRALYKEHIEETVSCADQVIAEYGPVLWNSPSFVQKVGALCQWKMSREYYKIWLDAYFAEKLMAHLEQVTIDYVLAQEPGTSTIDLPLRIVCLINRKILGAFVAEDADSQLRSIRKTCRNFLDRVVASVDLPPLVAIYAADLVCSTFLDQEQILDVTKALVEYFDATPELTRHNCGNIICQVFKTFFDGMHRKPDMICQDILINIGREDARETSAQIAHIATGARCLRNCRVCDAAAKTLV